MKKTDDALRRQAEKKQRELARWQKQKSRPKIKGYLLWMVLIVCLVYITDEIASQISTQMKTEIANDLFAKFGESSIAKLDLIALPVSFACMGISLFYKTLSDRYGRKLFLVVNTLGMGLGMTVIYLSQSIPMYIAGYCIISFFVPHDMQVVYITETAPKEHRAKIYSIVKCVATLGVMMIPLMRKTMMPEASAWRNVFLVPAIVGLVVAFAALILSRETDSFIDSRIRFLSKTPEELEAEKAAKSVENAQGGFFAAFRFGMKHKQLKWLFILMAFHNLGFIITMQYQVMLSYGYAENLIDAGLFTDIQKAVDSAGVNEVTSALFWFPVGSAIIQLLPGFISDKLGRKTAQAIMAGITVVSFISFIIGARYGISPWITGLLTGMCIGAFWAVGDTNVMMMSESTPTNLRSSMLSACYIISAIGTVIGVVTLNPLMSIFGNSATALITACISTPGIVVGLFLVLFKTHETKGTDIDTVTGTEWDSPAEKAPELTE